MALRTSHSIRTIDRPKWLPVKSTSSPCSPWASTVVPVQSSTFTDAHVPQSNRCPKLCKTSRHRRCDVPLPMTQKWVRFCTPPRADGLPAILESPSQPLSHNALRLARHAAQPRHHRVKAEGVVSVRLDSHRAISTCSNQASRHSPADMGHLRPTDTRRHVKRDDRHQPRTAQVRRPATGACSMRTETSGSARPGQANRRRRPAPPRHSATRISICQRIRLRSTARAVRCPLNTIPRGVS